MPYVTSKAKIFGKLQTAVGTPATLAATDVIAALNLTTSPEITSEENIYAGGSARDVETTIIDKTRTSSFYTFFPSAGTAGSSNVHFDWFEAYGAGQIVDAGVSLTSTNSVASEDVLTLQYFITDTSGTNRKVDISDASGTVDLEFEIDKRVMFKHTVKGNYEEMVQDAVGLTPDFTTQKSNIAQRLTKGAIITAKFQPFGTTVVEAKNICFGKGTLSNAFGMELTRYSHSCAKGFGVVDTAGDFKITILMEDVDALYNPEARLGEHHSFELVWGSVAGKTQTLLLSDVQLVNYADSELGPWAATELTFKNVGTTSFTLS